MLSKEIDKALQNCGYRFLNHEKALYCYGKPLGYGILRSDIPDDGSNISISLIVKGNKKDGKRPNLLWVVQIANFHLAKICITNMCY